MQENCTISGTSDIQSLHCKDVPGDVAKKAGSSSRFFLPTACPSEFVAVEPVCVFDLSINVYLS